MTVGQAGDGRICVRWHRATLMILAQHQFAQVQHLIVDCTLDVVRTFQSQRQCPARCADTTGFCYEAAIQIQTVVRCKADAPAITGNISRAHARYIQRCLCTGCIQHRTVTYYHKEVARLSYAGRRIDLTPNDDAAAIADLAVAIAADIDAGNRTCRHIKHCLFTDPDRAGMTRCFHCLADRTADTHAGQIDLAAPGIEPAIHRQLTDAADADVLAGINIDH
ncbi:hypothetical protein, partial [Herbaspirillum autotrophicum]|uniref:hypothetical protein n=1 Tax=Herbaspirillum autotrophicum TaxID=180195 RepID=UPI001E2E5DF5